MKKAYDGCYTKGLGLLVGTILVLAFGVFVSKIAKAEEIAHFITLACMLPTLGIILVYGVVGLVVRFLK